MGLIIKDLIKGACTLDRSTGLAVTGVGERLADVQKAVPDLANMPLVHQQAELRKIIDTDTGLAVTNVEEGYVNLVVPGDTYFRDTIFRSGAAKGGAASWKTLSSRDNTTRLPYVKEGKRAAQLDITIGSGTASYATIGVEDSYTDEGEVQSAMQLGGMSSRQMCERNLMAQFALDENLALAFSNADVALGTTPKPTGTAADVTPTSDLANEAHACYCVALTHEGYRLANMTDGLTSTISVTSPAGESYTLNGGTAKVSAVSDAVTPTLGQKITWSVTAVKGAFGYAWFVQNDGSGDFNLQGITTVNEFVQTAQLTTTQTKTAASVGSDYSQNDDYGLGGIYYQALSDTLANGYGYYVSLDGEALTMSNGLIDEIADMCEDLWDAYQLGPEVLLVSAKTYRSITELAFGSTENTNMMFVVEQSVVNSGFTVGGRVTAIVNPVTGEEMELRVLAGMPDSCILYARMNYVVPGTASNRSAEWETFGGTWVVDWQKITREKFHGIYAMGAVKVYYPGLFGGIFNIDVS